MKPKKSEKPKGQNKSLELISELGKYSGLLISIITILTLIANFFKNFFYMFHVRESLVILLFCIHLLLFLYLKFFTKHRNAQVFLKYMKFSFLIYIFVVLVVYSVFFIENLNKKPKLDFLTIVITKFSNNLSDGYSYGLYNRIKNKLEANDSINLIYNDKFLNPAYFVTDSLDKLLDEKPSKYGILIYGNQDENVYLSYCYVYMKNFSLIDSVFPKGLQQLYIIYPDSLAVDLNKQVNKQLNSLTALVNGLYEFFFGNKEVGLQAIQESEEIIAESNENSKFRAYCDLFTGNYLLKNQKFNEALEKYEHVIEKDTTSYETFNNRGVAYASAGNLKQAVKDFSKSIKNNSGNSYTYFNRGTTYINMGSFVDAIDDLKKVISLKPDFVDAYYYLGLAYSKLGKWDEAIDYFSMVLEYNPNYVMAYKYRGIAYASKDNFNKALNDYSDAIKFNPKDTLAYVKRGNLYFKKGKFTDALFDYNKALELDSTNIETRRNRGVLYSKRNIFSKALVDFTKVLKMCPNDVETLKNRGRVYYQLGQIDNAIVDYDKAIFINSKDIFAYKNRGFFYFQLNDFPKALIDCNKAINIDHKDIDSYVLRGSVHLQLGNLKDAIADFSTSLELDPTNEQAKKNLLIAQRKFKSKKS